MLVPENGQNRPSIAGVIQWLSVSLSQIYHWPHLEIANAAVPVARWVDSNVVPELQSLVGLDSHAGFDPISIKVVSTSVNTTIKQTDSKMKLIKNTGDSCTMPDTARIDSNDVFGSGLPRQFLLCIESGVSRPSLDPKQP